MARKKYRSKNEFEIGRIIESFTKVGGNGENGLLRRNEKSLGSRFLYEVFFDSVTIAGRVPRMITWHLSK